MGSKFIFAVGGTGGHLFPAQSIASDLSAMDSDAEIVFVGGGLHSNAFFDRSVYDYHEVSASPMSFKRALTGVGPIMRGVIQSLKIFKRLKPDAVIGFGSFQVFPVLLAAKLYGIPIILHEGNSYPGKITRLFSGGAAWTAIQFPGALKYLKGKIEMVSMVVPKGQKVSRDIAASYFGLDSSKFIILVFGGSQGALKLNLKVLKAANEMYSICRDMQIIHLTGNSEITHMAKELYSNTGIKAYVANFEKRIDLAWQCADIALTRAGAATISEIIHYRVPSIVVPYPYAADNHQNFNADFLVQIGGGIKVLEKDIEDNTITEILKHLIANDNKEIDTMRRALEIYQNNSNKKDMSALLCLRGDSKNDC